MNKQIIVNIIVVAIVLAVLYVAYLLFGWYFIPIGLVLAWWGYVRIKHDTHQQYYNNLTKIMKKKNKS